jgi:sodium pump decarboxylase gamma subunit
MAGIILSSDVSLPSALGISVLGLIIVFVVLVLLLVVILVMSKIIRNFRKDRTQPAAAAVPAALPVQKEAAGSCGKLKLYNVSERDAAMVMAIVADELKVPISHLRFISIKEVTNQ